MTRQGELTREVRAARTKSLVTGCLAAVSAGLLVVTMVWRDWVELLTGLDPDAGSGALEWAVTAAFAALALVTGCASLRARRRWVRLRRALPAPG
jgi:hypothetical protein